MGVRWVCAHLNECQLSSALLRIEIKRCDTRLICSKCQQIARKHWPSCPNYILKERKSTGEMRVHVLYLLFWDGDFFDWRLGSLLPLNGHWIVSFVEIIHKQRAMPNSFILHSSYQQYHRNWCFSFVPHYSLIVKLLQDPLVDGLIYQRMICSFFLH